MRNLMMAAFTDFTPRTVLERGETVAYCVQKILRQTGLFQTKLAYTTYNIESQGLQ